jgi:glutaminase
MPLEIAAHDQPQAHVSTGRLPDPDAARRLIETAYERYRGVADGTVASYIPALAQVSPDLFGVSVVAVNGNIHSVGDSDHPFTVQSIAKAFVFALVLEAIGADEARRRLGVNSTGLPFNSVMAIELRPDGTTNPMVNPGAIATTSLVPGDTAAAKWEHLHAGMSAFAGRELVMDEEVYASEAAANGRNEGLAHLMHSYERMWCDPDEATDVYTRQCSLLVTAQDLAAMGATLANGGVNPLTGVRVIAPDHCHRVLAVMMTCGLYENSGDWLYDIGLPGKSGVGGGIVTVSPGKGGLGTFSPPLDAAGNSVRGCLATAYLSRQLGINLLVSEPAAATVASPGDRRVRVVYGNWRAF